MEESSSKVTVQNGGSQNLSEKGYTKKTHRSSECCRSCTATMVADCVALCCCPCAVLSFLSLTFFKAPWMVGRRCLGRGKKEKKCEKIGKKDTNDVSISRRGIEVILENVENDGEFGNLGSKCEAEGVLIELYQLGHLGFGRGSFTGI